MDTSKIIRGVVSNGRYTVTAPIVKEDYGLVLKIEGVELPSSYQVDFSNSENNGTSVTMIGNADGVLIPHQFISTGKDVFAFLYHVGADFGRTVYKFRIPNKVRPDRTDETPTPEEQSVIDQTISALNDAVESTQEAQQAIENMSVSAQTLAEGESATVTKTESEGVVHLAFGIPTGATGAKGDKGDRGEKGETGAQGAKGDKGDKGDTGATGPQGIQGIQGETGADGISPTVTITPITGGHRITITDADGEHSADVMDGQTPTVPVDDVQINGTSIVADGVANVPIDTSLTIAGAAADSKATGDGISALKEDLTQISAQIRVIAARDDSWRAIKENVKMGFGELLYPVGTEFEVECPSGAPYNSIIFVVVDHRVENSEHIMTMLMKHVIYSTEFDAIQAIICPEETMPAGTYHFALLSGYDTAYDGGKNVQFTLANDLEAGGQIVMSWPYNQTWIGKNLTVYHAFGTSAIETCVMSEGTGGTDLGVADGTVSFLNHTHRARYGSNNYKESAIRNWLDSNDAANTWQTQQTRFQRPCSYRTRAGFVTYLDPEFVAVIREGTHLNRTNEIFDLNGKKQTYSTTDKFYLASQEEIGFSSESGIVCGSVFDYYNGASQADKIKYDINSQATARYWWLRTPYPSYAYGERGVYSSGALSDSFARGGFGAVAACEI